MDYLLARRLFPGETAKIYFPPSVYLPMTGTSNHVASLCPPVQSSVLVTQEQTPHVINSKESLGIHLVWG